MATISAAANDNRKPFGATIDRAVPGQAITLAQPYRRFGRCYAEFVAHIGDGKHILVRKLISSTWRARWTKPLMVARADVIEVHGLLARGAA